MFNQTGCSMGGAMLCLLLKPIQFIVFSIVFYIFQLNFYKTNVKMVVKDVIFTEDYTKQACSLLCGDYVALQCVLPLSKNCNSVNLTLDYDILQFGLYLD